MTAAPTIRYLNTDLDLVCGLDPSMLASEFEMRGLAVHVTPGDDGLFYVMCEDSNDTEPEPNIRRLLDAIDALSVDARRIWAQCSKREFNVGYECGDEPWAFNQGLSNDVLRRMADCGASFRITLYPYRPERRTMRLNHLGISVTDVHEASAFLEKYFGLRSIGKASVKMAHLQDDGGLILSLFRGPPITEPEATHVGFMQETEEQVDAMYERLKSDGYDVPPPSRSHGWTFAFVAPGGFAIEVVC